MAQSSCLSEEKEALPENTPTKFPRGSEFKQTQTKQQGGSTNAKYQQGDQLLLKNPAIYPHVQDASIYQPGFSSSPVPPSSQEVLWQTEPYSPMDMPLNHQGKQGHH